MNLAKIFSAHKAFILFFLVFLTLSVLFIAIGERYGDARQPQGTSEGLSSEEYGKVRGEFLAMVNDEDPRVALARLRERIKTDDAVLRSCHVLVHEIGHASYGKYKDFGEAMKYQDEICNSGYLHGIIETYFSESSDVFEAMKTVCSEYPPGGFMSWECYHGIGHGLMYYTSNDLPRSISMCDSFDDGFASLTCANGVFMENFNTDQKLHRSSYLREDDLFYPCAEQKAEYKGECYLYAPTFYLGLNKNNYANAIQWCSGAEKDFISTCIVGVGNQAIKENINDPKFVESVCMTGKNNQVSACIGGMVGLYINHFGGLDEAKLLCESLEMQNRNTCFATVKAKSSWFEI